MLELIKRHPQILLFGILATMFSGPGQTFLVSLFIPPMQESFGLTKSGIAGIYSLATLASAFFLPVMGNLLDRIHLIWFTLIAGILMAVGCLLLSVSQGLVLIFIGFFLIRNLGQGTLTMIASTTMARIFGSKRGKAIAISNLGFPLGEAIFPLLLSSWIFFYDWRSGWVLLAVLTLLFFSPTVFFLLRKSPHERAYKQYAKPDRLEKEVSASLHDVKDWSVGEMIRDPRFFLLLLPVLIPPGFLTALFFHQGSIADWKGWNIQVIASAFIAFALTRAIVSLVIGPMIDRLGARRLYPFSLVPLCLGFLCLCFGGHTFWVFMYLAFCGMTIGLEMTIKGALFAELYGVKQLGSIKGVLSSLMVLSTAVAPILVGGLLDLKIGFSSILWAMIAFSLVGIFLASLACKSVKRTI